MEGNYEVLVTLHSLVLLESRCAECFKLMAPIQRNSCCDRDNESSCPDSCDILLRFCQLSDLQFTTPVDRLLGTQCAQLLSRGDSLLGYNFKSGEIYQFNETGSLGGTFSTLSNPVTYYGAGKWVSSVIYFNYNIHKRPTERSTIEYISY